MIMLKKYSRGEEKASKKHEGSEFFKRLQQRQRGSCCVVKEALGSVQTQLHLATRSLVACDACLKVAELPRLQLHRRGISTAPYGGAGDSVSSGFVSRGNSARGRQLDAATAEMMLVKLLTWEGEYF